jgi:MOSC domain-containing protein YiiM
LIEVMNVCTGRASRVRIDGRLVATAIGKTPREGDVTLGSLGLDGDEQADPTVHGGVSKAVYAYPVEHLPFWQTVRAQARVALWDEPVPPGLFGENLLLRGLVGEDKLWIGDRLVLPHCVLAVSEPRFPCFKFNAAMGFAQASKLMAQSGFCGSYFAVLQPGTVRAGEVGTLEPGPREVSIRELFRAKLGR